MSFPGVFGLLFQPYFQANKARRTSQRQYCAYMLIPLREEAKNGKNFVQRIHNSILCGMLLKVLHFGT